jgi:hypothetical protein
MAKKKKSANKSAAATPTDDSGTVAASPHRGKKSKDRNGSLTAQIDQAEATVMQNKLSTQVLHQQWRKYLLMLSYLLIVLTFHQSQSPMAACLQDIKAWNGVQKKDANLIPGNEAMLIVLKDSAVNLLAVVMATLLAFFLKDEESHSDFSNSRFILATLLMVPMIGIHRYQTAQHGTNGCIDDLLAKAKLESTVRKRDFPVVLVFHVIVTLCYAFMDWQMAQHAKSILLVTKLRTDLETSTSAAAVTGTDDSRKTK